MDKHTIVGMILFFALFVGYSQYTSWRYPDYGKTKQTLMVKPADQKPMESAAMQGSSTLAPNTGNSQQPVAALPSGSTIPEQDLSIDTDTTVYRFSMNTGSLSAVLLKNYKDQIKVEDSKINLIPMPFSIQGETSVEKLIPATSGFQGERQGRVFRFWREEGPWIISQEYKIPERGYAFTLNVTFRNKSDKPQELTAVTLFGEDMDATKPVSRGFMPGVRPESNNLISFMNNSVERTNVAEYCKKGEGVAQAVKDNEVTYFGFDRHYFLKSFQPGLKKISILMQKSRLSSDSICPMAISAYQPFGQVQPGETVSMPYSAFFGPKDVDVLVKYGESLKSSIDLGWFTIIAHPLLAAINFFHYYAGNYGVDIIILTILLKLIFYPLVKSSTVSMKKMQKLQPEMNRIKEIYAEDKGRQQQELMKFMGANKINPAKGCLPILPQIPVFVALYNVLANAIELRHAPFYGYIRDLSAADPYYITPILLGIGMFAQQKLTPSAGMDKTQQKIMMMMPVMFTVMMLSLPSGLVLYMLTNTIISIGQQQWLNKRVIV